ncbi:hypothetical protein [Nonomuraea turcica]|uniref:hypothetical protein n=1 Tax=Nonomuraea sp. G32 TaxID=3067274 RepID=UPI00273AE183|nr:hypothetical protein [Nonomuraea sp. G32]MDP4508481.1 hypothetical protein [Nonomuraea sp. G32]
MDEIVEEGWRAFLEREFDTTEPSDERVIAEMVVDEPDKHPWRVVDAAYDRLTCAECGDRLSRGPATCAACNLAHGFRYSAIEIDRPGVPPGNEHALRVNVSVARRPYGISESEVLLRRLSLPILLDGLLPTTTQAQATKAMANKGATEAELAALIYAEWGRA